MDIEIIKIEDLGKVITGKTPSTENDEYWVEEIPFITPTDIKRFDVRYIDTTERYISKEAIVQNAAKMIPKNTICLTCIGSTIGKICISNIESATNQQINALIPYSKYNFKYIYYLFRYLLPHFRLIGSGTGSGKDILNATKFKKMKIEIHSNANKRNTIGEILFKFDDLIENNNKCIRILEKLVEEIYKEWFVRFRFPGYEIYKFHEEKPHNWKYSSDNQNMIPNKWHYGQLIELGQFIRGKNITSENMINGDIPVISAGIQPSGYHNEANVFGKSLTMSASGANAGYLKYNLENIWAADCSYYQNEQNIWFVYSSLKFIRSSIENLQVGAAQPHVYPKNINKLNIIIPEEKYIKLFNERVYSIFEEIKILNIENKNLIKQRDLLLPRLMSGKLEVK